MTADSDPYRNFLFRLRLDGRPVAGFVSVEGLSAPGALTMRRGIVRDPDFFAWISARDDGGRAIGDLVLEVFDEWGGRLARYRIAAGRVQRIVGMPYLDAMPGGVIQTLVVLHDGCDQIQPGASG